MIEEIKQSAASSVQAVHEELICLEVLLLELLNQKSDLSYAVAEQEDYILRLEELEESIKMQRSHLLDFWDDFLAVDVKFPVHVPRHNQSLNVEVLPINGDFQNLGDDDDDW